MSTMNFDTAGAVGISAPYDVLRALGYADRPAYTRISAKPVGLDRLQTIELRIFKRRIDSLVGVMHAAGTIDFTPLQIHVRTADTGCTLVMLMESQHNFGRYYKFTVPKDGPCTMQLLDNFAANAVGAALPIAEPDIVAFKLRKLAANRPGNFDIRYKLVVADGPQ